MANQLAGDFDVVAEFAIGAVNRVLAAMHRVERFLHSIAIRVDDTAPPGSITVKPSILGTVDAHGDAAVDHRQIGAGALSPGQSAAAGASHSVLHAAVNMNLTSVQVPPFVPSHLKGRAQVQLFPPRMEIADASGKKVTVRLDMMSRYFPDRQTPPVAEFVRGELQITAPVNQAPSTVGGVVAIDLTADDLQVNFIPIRSSTPLSAEDLAGINLLIRNALKTSFLPSNITLDGLPPTIKHVQFKTLPGSPDAVAIMLNMHGGAGDPASVNSGFLDSKDDFAFAAGKEFILSAFPPVPRVRDHRLRLYTLSFNSRTIELQDGRFLLTIRGHADSNFRFIPGFGFTLRQALKLNLVATTADGPLNTAELVLFGDLSISVGGVPIPSGFTGAVRDRISEQLNDENPAVRDMLNVDKNLGGLLGSLLTPPSPNGTQQSPQSPASLAYTSVNIQPSGIVLHGSLAVTDWPDAHVEFEQIPSREGGGVAGAVAGIFQGPDYSALKSWIPGGTIRQYEWKTQGQTQPGFIDENKFVLIHPPPVVSSGGTPSTGTVPGSATDSSLSATEVPGYAPLCVTVRGVRLSSSGPVVDQPVAATVCGFTSFSIVKDLEVAPDNALPLVALTHPGPDGRVQIAGHTSARVDETGRSIPNLIVHFADEKSANHLDLLTRALAESRRDDAATAILAVVTPDQLTRARYTAGVVYADNQDSAWERVFGVKATRRPVTLIVAPTGTVVWQHDGDVDSPTLAAALRQYLAARGPVSLSLLSPSVRIGDFPPNFLFEHAPGRQLILRKLAGRPVTLVFWKSSSKPSIEAVSDLQRTTVRTGGRQPVVLAINDGEAVETARRVAAENGFPAILVTDPERRIARAYSVNMWPTIVFIDAFGLVGGIRYGRLAGDRVGSRPEQTPAYQGER